MNENCRPETVAVDGEEVPVLVRGHDPLDDAGRAALAEVVKASLDRANRTVTVRQRAIDVLEEHRAVQGGCLCGSSATGRRHVVHVVGNLANAGVLRPLYDSDPPSPVPRVWKKGDPEPDITGLRLADGAGNAWFRYDPGDTFWWTGAWPLLTWEVLVRKYGPLVEVREDGLDVAVLRAKLQRDPEVIQDASSPDGEADA